MNRTRHKAPLQPHEPDLPTVFDSTEFPDGAMAPGGRYSDLDLTNWTPGSQSGEALTFDTVSMTNPHLASTRWPKLRLMDVRFRDGDLSNAIWAQASLNRIVIGTCRLTGCRMNESQIRDVRFVDCKADLTQFRFSKFKSVRFENCDLREADFQGADLRDVVFQGCDLSGAHFSGANLNGADMRGSRLESLNLLPADLEGLVIDQVQSVELAPFLAALLGLVVISEP